MVSRIDENGYLLGNFQDSESDWIIADVTYNGKMLFPKWDGTEWVETATTEQIEQNRSFKIEELRILYRNKIDDVVKEAVQRNIIEGTPIPQEVIDERQRLRNEYNTLVNEL